MSLSNIPFSYKADYMRALGALCRKYPSQEKNRSYYLAWLERALVGTITAPKGIRTKGNHSYYPKGTVVLYVPDETLPGRYEIWAPGVHAELVKTLVRDSDVNGPKYRPDNLSDDEFYYLMDVKSFPGEEFFPLRSEEEKSLVKKGYIEYIGQKAALTRKGLNYQYDAI